jgi:bacillithiol biosynthesis deacetylase BshB1
LNNLITIPIAIETQTPNPSKIISVVLKTLKTTQMIKLDILAIGAHPDDVELGCGATLAKEIKAGKVVGILDLTQGELGTRGTVEIRQQEAEKAAQILGVRFRENLNLPDGFIFNNRENQLKLIEKIRQYQPDIVLTNAIDDRHTDHAKASDLTTSACFLSGLMKIETQFKGQNQTAWRPKHVFHYIQWKNLNPDFVVDVSAFLEVKMQAVKAYESQVFNPNSEEPMTPIASSNFLDSIRYRARDLGRIIGVESAEGFTAERVVAVKSLDDLL